MLQDLRTKLFQRKISLADAVAQAMPEFRGRIPDERLMWLVNELQGYPHALDWFQQPSADFPEYRVVNGALKILSSTGEVSDLQHPLASRKRFFIAASIRWLEDSLKIPGPITFVEMAELNAFTKQTQGGAIVCEMQKDQITRILTVTGQGFVKLLDLATGAAKPKPVA